MLLADGQLAEAQQKLEKLYLDQPDAVRRLLVEVLLRQAQAAGEADDQLAFYEKVLNLEPDREEALRGCQRIWTRRGEAALQGDDLEAALVAYRQAGLPEQVAEIETELHRRRLEEGLQEVARLEQAEDYRAALDLAQQLHRAYPEKQDILPDLPLLERKARLDDLYRQAVGGAAE